MSHCIHNFLVFSSVWREGNTETFLLIPQNQKLAASMHMKSLPVANLLHVATALPHSKHSGAISFCSLFVGLSYCCSLFKHTQLQKLAQWKGAQQEMYIPKQASASTWNNNCSSTVGPLLCTVMDWLWCEDESLHSVERDDMCMLRVVLFSDILPATPSNPSVVRPKA